MRPLWKGAVSFGLVNIPVRLYAATGRRDPQFHYIHKVCGSPVRYVKWCPHCDREVPGEEIAWGHEYEKGKYVLLSDEDLEGVPSPAPRTVSIEDFIDAGQVDPIFYDKTYFLEPAEGGAKAYGLLRRAMKESGRVALGRVAVRSKESLATVRLYGEGVLVMETMFWPDEIRRAESLDIPEVDDVGEREAQMAHTLVEMLSSEFDPSKYRSERRERLEAVIDARVEGREVEIRPPATAKVIDLMEALRKSIAGAEQERAGREGAHVEGPAEGQVH